MAGARRMHENAAARRAAASVSDFRFTVRQQRAETRSARLSERAKRATEYAALVASDDNWIGTWLDRDRRSCQQCFDNRRAQLAVPPALDLPFHLARHAADDARRLLDAVSRRWAHPPVALTGRSAQAVWSGAATRRSAIGIELAPLRSRGEASRFLAGLGAVPQSGGGRFDFGDLTVQLRPSPPDLATLVRWSAGTPYLAIPVERPEEMSAAVIDRHTVRAVLESADRDRRGRRHPPYHESLGVPVRPLWFDPTSLTGPD